MTLLQEIERYARWSRGEYANARKRIEKAVAPDAREALYRDLVAGRALDAKRVADVARELGIPAEAVLLDLYVEAFGVA